MPLSSNINSYADIAAVLTQALPHKRATYTLPTDGAAVHWMQRAYKYRQLLQKQVAAESGVKGFQPPTDFDRMKLVRRGSAVEIDFNPAPQGELMLPTGEKRQVEIAPADARKASRLPPQGAPLRIPTPVEDDLAAQAAALLALEGDADET